MSLEKLRLEKEGRMEKETIAMVKEKLKREETIRLEQLEWEEKCKNEK